MRRIILAAALLPVFAHASPRFRETSGQLFCQFETPVGARTDGLLTTAPGVMPGPHNMISVIVTNASADVVARACNAAMVSVPNATSSKPVPSPGISAGYVYVPSSALPSGAVTLQRTR